MTTASLPSRRTRFTAALASLVFAMPAYAQQASPTAARPVRNVAAIADSIAFAGDTTRAVAMLDSAVRANRRDAASWHQLGVLLWNQAKSRRSGGNMRDLDAVRLLTAADSSLRMATQLSPDSTRFWMSLTQFSAEAGTGTLNAAAGMQARNALEAAEKGGDRIAIAVSADAAGLAAWRRYETAAKRALASDGRQVDVSMFSNIRRDQATDYLATFVKRIEPPTGNADYQEAVNLFRRALDADPTNQRIARRFFMALGEREQWQEMRAVAARRLAEYPYDWQSWLARGLAAHRLGEGVEAQTAFDSALVFMADSARDRMTSLSRVLRPSMRAGEREKRPGGIGDAQAYQRLDQAQQNAVSALYWLMADPLAITPENEHRNEFFARITWADFRWTSEDQGLLGADTDRGDIFIRYGPPRIDMLIPGNSSNTQGAGHTIAWVYEGQLVFFFDMMPGFLSARTAFFDKDFVDQVKDAAPVSWANVPATRALDTIPIMTTRFRAGRDSVDVLVAASVPVDSMVRGLTLDRASVDVDIRVFDRFVQVRGAESRQAMLAPDTVRLPTHHTWVKRIGPGLNLLRVEALQKDSKRAARALTQLSPDIGAGFGMSDILLGSAPSPRGNVTPKGWRDIQTTPSSGTFPTAQIGLTWEMYELVERDGQAKYRIDVAVERVSKGLRGFTARIVDNLGRTIGREASGTNSLAFAFDRSAPASPTIVEFLTVNLGDATAGEYRLRVTITDQASRLRTERTTSFRIR